MTTAAQIQTAMDMAAIAREEKVKTWRVTDTLLSAMRLEPDPKDESLERYFKAVGEEIAAKRIADLLQKYADDLARGKR